MVPKFGIRLPWTPSERRIRDTTAPYLESTRVVNEDVQDSEEPPHEMKLYLDDMLASS